MARRSLLAILVLLVVLAGGMVSAEAAVAAPAARVLAASRQPVIDSVSPVAGPVRGGTTVVLRGANFENAGMVKIGGRTARKVSYVSPRVMRVVTPRHAAGSAAISIQGTAGTYLPSKVRFHYLRPPRISGLSAHSGPVTGRQDVTIEGSNLSYVTAVWFGALRASVLAHSARTRLRVRTPASWAGTVRVVVRTDGGVTARSAADRFTYANPAPRLTGQVTAAAGDVVATGADVTAVSGGQAVTSSTGVSQAPWLVTLSASAPVPAVGQRYLLEPGSPVYQGGLAGAVTAVDTSTSPATITVSAVPGSLASAVSSARVVFTGPLGDASASSGGVVSPASLAQHGAAPAGSSLTSTVDFGSISAGSLSCQDSHGLPITVTGSLSLKLEHVEAHVEVDVGSLLSKPFIDVWVTYQPTLAVSLTAGAEADCALPASFQTTHEKLFFLGDTGATIAIAPDAAFTVSAGGTVSFRQHSYRMLGFETNPDGSISRLDGQSSDPAQVKVTGELKAEAYGGVQVQVGELNAIGAGMSLDGGFAATASSDWPPQVCLSGYPFLRGTLYAYLNDWVSEWKLQAFSVELDLAGLSSCSGTGWHVAWQSKTNYALSVTCPTASDCFVAGRTPKDGYLLRTHNGGATWASTTITGLTAFYDVACVNASSCVAGGDSAKVAVTSTGGATWSLVRLPYVDSRIAAVGGIACLPGGTCYATAAMTKYSGDLVYSSANSGRTWEFVTLVPNYVDAMTCLSTSTCLGAGQTPENCSLCGLGGLAGSEATQDGWMTAGAGSFPAKQSVGQQAVSCLRASLCYSAGFGQGFVTRNFGKTWGAISVDRMSAWAASCVPGAMCVLGGYGPNSRQYVATTYDGGRTWKKSTITNYPAADGMFAVSLACPSPGHCMAIEIGDGPTVIVAS